VGWHSFSSRMNFLGGPVSEGITTTVVESNGAQIEVLGVAFLVSWGKCQSGVA
jgi:hypothetical protein